jgi:transposase InsO family protein
VQEQLRAAFARWGLPWRLRVDNGKPWGSWSDLPTALALWLIGLGVELLWNPPRRPQDNGVVERSQGTAKRWGDPGSCDSAAQLQRELDEADRLQRELYPLAGGRSRWEVYPGLRHSGRPYTAALEAGRWQLERVLGHLAGYAVKRRVDSTGQVSVYDRNYYVGVLHRGREVYVQFDPQRREWLFSDRQGQCLRSQPAVEIEAERLRTLQLAGPKRKRS